MEKRRQSKLYRNRHACIKKILRIKKFFFFMDITESPKQKVYAVISKGYTEEKYSVIEKQDKSINIKEGHFTEEIERLLEWGKR